MRVSRLLFLAVFVAITTGAFAQNGRLSGIITESGSKEPVPFATIIVKQGNIQKGGAAADIDGNYGVYPLTPGTYNIEVQSLGFQKKIINNVVINFETTTRLNIQLSSESKMLNEVEIVDYSVPLVDFDNTSTGAKLTAKDIEKMPTRSISAVAAQTAGVFSADDGGGLNVRGGRTGDNAYFVNGVRVFGNTLPPVESIAEMSVITGGVPAQYGDVIGGVVSITTKGPASKTAFSVQAESSRPFDKLNQDLLGITVSGPLLKIGKRDTTQKIDTRPTKLGYFANVTMNGARDTKYSALGYWHATDQAIADLKKTPYQPFGEAYYSSADFYSKDKFYNQSYRNNSDYQDANLNGVINYQLNKNTMVTMGGSFNILHRRNFENDDFALFNYENNGRRIDYDYNVFANIRQTFTNVSDSGRSIIKNVFYQLQVDYSAGRDTRGDGTHWRNFSDYGYVGKFENPRTTLDTRTLPAGSALSTYVRRDPITGDSLQTFSLVNTNSKTFFIRDGQVEPLKFTPGTQNPDVAYLNTWLMDRRSYVSPSDLYVDGGALNSTGRSLRQAGYFFDQPGNRGASFTISDFSQFRVSAQAGAEIGKHTFKAGFEYEQRTNASYSHFPFYYQFAEILTNRHILPVYSGATLAFDTTINGADTSIFVTAKPTVLGGEIKATGQTEFDKKLRAKLGVPINERINVDALDPSLLTIDMFTPNEIFNNGGQSVSSWQGFTAHGKRAGRSSFNDFFLDTINRPIDAYRPIYLAGYIEDKFEIKDFVLRLGLRIDRYDLNQPVLRDPYSTTRLTTVGETDITRFNRGTFEKTSIIQDDWVVYLDKPLSGNTDQGAYEVVGFRGGDRWYDASGRELANPIEISRNGNFNPYFDVSRLSPFERELQDRTGITLDAFRDYEPQINLLPRVSFSFPISEDAGFFAHYDVLTRRPTAVQGGLITGSNRAGSVVESNPFGNPLQYYTLKASSNPFIINPDLKPQRTIDYELGFRQRLTKSSAITISGFYREIKDLVQITQVLYAYPTTYSTVGNQDFGVVKGLEISYDLRRTNNVRIGANYTLQFADGSASDLATSLLNTGSPFLRVATPLNYDQRHAIKITFDYRLDHGKGPQVFGSPIFQDMGFNVTLNAGSGTPYTRWVNNWGARSRQIDGAINGARLPWNSRTGIRIDKTIYLVKGDKSKHNLNIYYYVQNLFDARNIIYAHPRTGDPENDGYLTSDFGKQITASQPSPETYAFLYALTAADPDNYSLPRRMRIGITYRF